MSRQLSLSIAALLFAASVTNALPLGESDIFTLAAATPDLSTFVAALKAGKLVDYLSGKDCPSTEYCPFTVFAPTNEAFARLPTLYLKLLLDPANIKSLDKLLEYHIIYPGPGFSKDITDNEVFRTEEGEDVTAHLKEKPFDPYDPHAPVVNILAINNATVTTADVTASNGVLHIIDRVLMPSGMPPVPTNTKNIVALAAATPELSTLVAALKAGELADFLSGKGSFSPFTVFAPTNEAFAKLPAGVLARLLDPKNVPKLARLLEYHVVSGAAIFSKDLKTFQTVKTLEGDQVTIVKAGRVVVNNATVTMADIAATNGVIHIIDSVLIPPPPPGPDLLQTIYHKPELSTFVIALRHAGRIICLSSESPCGPTPFTIFAPSNDAWNVFLGQYPLLLDLSNVVLLQQVLDYHFVAGAVFSKDITDNEVISTKEGEDVTAHIKEKPFDPYDPHAPVVNILTINNATVTTADLAATNGVVHILDSVLRLPNFPPPGNYTFPYHQ
jgi:transforming growth factor-beta-induced protein